MTEHARQSERGEWCVNPACGYMVMPDAGICTKCRTPQPTDLERRVKGEITAEEYVRRLDERVARRA